VSAIAGSGSGADKETPMAHCAFAASTRHLVRCRIFSERGSQPISLAASINAVLKAENAALHPPLSGTCARSEADSSAYRLGSCSRACFLIEDGAAPARLWARDCTVAVSAPQ
jgi:hypothetical protein